MLFVGQNPRLFDLLVLDTRPLCSDQTHSGSVHSHVNLGAARVNLNVQDLASICWPSWCLHVGWGILWKDEKTTMNVKSSPTSQQNPSLPGCKPQPTIFLSCCFFISHPPGVQDEFDVDQDRYQQEEHRTSLTHTHTVQHHVVLHQVKVLRLADYRTIIDYRIIDHSKHQVIIVPPTWQSLRRLLLLLSLYFQLRYKLLCWRGMNGLARGFGVHLSIPDRASTWCCSSCRREEHALLRKSLTQILSVVFSP